MSVIRFSAALLLLLFLVGCQAAPPPAPATATQVSTDTPTLAPTSSPTPAVTATLTPFPPIPVQIDRQQVRQTLREVGGGNFIHFFGGVTTALDPISTLNIDTLHPRVVRVRIDLDQWDPEPGVTGEERFQLGPHVRATFEFMKELKSRDAETIFIASIWKVPDWMVRDPAVEQARIIPPDRFPKVVDSIGGWLLHAKEEYGVDVDYVSFNEANIGVTVSLLPSEQVELIRLGGPALKEMGLKTLWLLGDVSNMASFPGYIPPIYAAEDIRPYLGPLSFHSWDSGSPDQFIRDIGKFADQNNLEVWCTEAGWDPAQWHHPSEFLTWKHAMRLANIYTRVLRDSRTTTMLYWDMMGTDYNINDGKKPFPALVYFDQLKQHFPAGAQIVATPDDQILTLTNLSLAAITPNNGFSVEVVNQVKTERTVALSGLPDGTYTLTRITEQEGVQQLDSVQVKDGKAELTLPGMSISFLKLEQ